MYKEQEEALAQLFSKRDVFINLPTSYGKSLIFQAAPIMADILFRRSTGTSIVVVISPLKALMEDQVRHLNKLGLSAVCVSDQHDDRLVQGIIQSRTQSNACARARLALALGKLNFSCAVIGLTCMPTKPEPLNLGVPVVNFPRANAILARAQALLWVRDWVSSMVSTHTYMDHLNAFSNQLGEEYLGARNFENHWCVLPWMKPTVLVNGKISR